jgi:hypothetical protein
MYIQIPFPRAFVGRHFSGGGELNDELYECVRTAPFKPMDREWLVENKPHN